MQKLSWEELTEQCKNCTSCELCKSRRNVVIGRGNVNAPLLFVGEGPGEQEDIKGEPFVGAAGRLLDLLLTAQMFNKEDYYIANIVKCRPPGNRVPTEEEAQSCMPFLRQQVMLIKPKIIICLGATAMRYLIDKDLKITKARGNWIECGNFLMMPVFHPSAVLRDESKKILMWQDFKKIKKRLDSICQEKNS